MFTPIKKLVSKRYDNIVQKGKNFVATSAFLEEVLKDFFPELSKTRYKILGIKNDVLYIEVSDFGLVSELHMSKEKLIEKMREKGIKIRGLIVRAF